MVAITAASTAVLGASDEALAATPMPSATAGSAAVGSTSYAIPSGALFVAPRGSDLQGTGSQSAPFATINHALSASRSGATIVLRAGTYHESVVVNSTKSVTIESYPKESVWLDGSVPVTGWAKSGSAWMYSGWTTQFDSTPSYSGSVSNSADPNWSFVTAAHPMAAHPDQVFLDGAELVQVSAVSELMANSFYVDYGEKKLYIGADPTGHTVRATDLASAMIVVAPNVVVQGIGIRRFATPVNQVGAVRLRAIGDTLRNVTIASTATTGLDVAANNVTLSHVTVQANGMLGVHANNADGLMVDGSSIRDNNSQGFNIAPAAGGLKVSQTRGVVVRNSLFQSNVGTGLWFDESTYNFVATGNTIQYNTVRGITGEISSHGIIANNLLRGNGRTGIFLEDTDNVQIWNNTFAANTGDIQVFQDARTNVPSTPGHDSRQPNPDSTMPWISQDITISNNVLGSGWPYLITVSDGSTAARSANQMHVTVDGNLLALAGSGQAELAWSTGGTKLKAYTASQFAAANGQGSSNRDAAPQRNGFFTHDQIVASAHARVVPDSVCSAMGRPSGTRWAGVFWTVES